MGTMSNPKQYVSSSMATGYKLTISHIIISVLLPLIVVGLPLLLIIA